MKRSLFVRKVAVVLALAGAALACGDDDPLGSAFPTQVIGEVEFAEELGVNLDSMEMLPAGTFIQDEEEGTGEIAEVGDTIDVLFTGWLIGGTQFDNGRFVTPLQVGSGTQEGLIPGFVDGVVGMREGGRRLIVIPPDQGFGDAGTPTIPPGSILVFRVTLNEVTKT